jgi:DNA-binding transcriptional LysR family regulator
MKRILRLRGLWDYLPAFRVVAECEHLPTASRVIGVSPPALSRAIHLLEEALGRTLFDRSGARLRLNDGGRHFLAAVRAAMRTLDDGVDEVLEGLHHAAGEVLVAFPSEAAGLVARWIAALAVVAPEMILRQVAPAVELATAVRRGDLDVALVPSPPSIEELESFEVGPIPWRLYGRRGRGRLAQPWRVVVTPRAPWPSDEPRLVVTEVAELATAALAVGQTGDLLAFLPEFVAVAGGLRAVGKVSAATSLHALHRAPVGRHPRTELALSALRAATLGRGDRLRGGRSARASGTQTRVASRLV